MSDNTNTIDLQTIEQESNAIAPLVRTAIAEVAGLPSPATMQSIRDAAIQHLATRRRRRFLKWSYVAAALVVLSLTSSTLIYQSQTQSARLADLNTLITLTTSEEDLSPELNKQELASRLLEIQGLSEEEFFSFPEEEPLWL